MNWNLLLKRLPMILGDIVALQLALALTLLLRYGGWSMLTWQQHLPAFGWVTALWVVGLYVAGMYDPSKSRNGLAFFRLFLEAMLANLLVAFTFFYLVTHFGIAPRTNLFLFYAVSCVTLYGWRLTWNRFAFQHSLKNRLLLIGTHEDILALHRLLADGTLGMTLAAVIQTDANAQPNLPRPHGLRWETDIRALEHLIAEEKITTVVPGHGVNEIPVLRDALYRLLFTPITLLDRRELEETLTGRIPLAHVDKAWFIEHLREPDKAWYESAKRAVDLVLAIPFVTAFFVLFPFIAAVIKLSSKGPVLYSQERVGKAGKRFRIWKFRTMHTDSEKNGPQFTTSAKTDPRLFTAGRILRQLRIDELPQIWNVIAGHLSLIGPRPERPEFVTPLVERMPYYALRHLTRPGLTGWAQVQFLEPTTSLEDNLKKLQYDLYYIQHRSLLLDAAILLKTIGIVLRRQGT